MTLAEAQQQAERHGLPSYLAWRADLERRYDVMPPWYWREAEARYCRYVEQTVGFDTRLDAMVNALRGAAE